MKTVTLYRRLCSVVMMVFVALGLASKAYSGWGEAWVQGYSGDLLYQMFWIWLVGTVKVRWRVDRIAAIAFLVSALIECSQIIPFPAAWQDQIWWRLLLGTSFSGLDFVYYAAGCVIGAISLSTLKQKLGLKSVQKQFC